VIRTAVVKTVPISAEAAAMSSKRRVPLNSTPRLATKTTKNARNPIQAAGTWM
jgi:hypothetical protein